MEYAELQITSNFSFLHGASHPDELIIMAKALGLRAAAITDRNTLAGIVRGHVAAKEHNLPFIPAVRLDLMKDGPARSPDASAQGLSLLAYPTDRKAYARLTELLTIGNRRASKGHCHIWLDDVASFSKGMIFALLPDTADEDLSSALPVLREKLDTSLYLAASHGYRGKDRHSIARLSHIGKQAGTPLLATGNIYYHTPERRRLADVLSCIREHVLLDEAGYLLAPNAERFLKPASEMARLFDGHEHALKATLDIAEACSFSLQELEYNYPKEPVPESVTPQEQLATLSRAGLEDRFPEGVPKELSRTLEHELEIVGRKHYAPYFLTVYDIVSYARHNGILCQGRGSAANSLICYALKITDVNPVEVKLLFERFVSDARKEPPDIDVDFEHERREEVIQYIYERYGRHRAGLAATLITYRARSAIRDVGKVMGLSEDTLGAMAGTIWGSYDASFPDERVREAGFDPSEPRLSQTLTLAHEIVGFPRHLSQHVGGFVLTESPLHEIVPIQNAAMDNRTVIEWTKDDLAALNILKVDVLALGMLTCLRKAFGLLHAHRGISLDLAMLPKEDKATYDMMQKADTIGVFQVESRAQMSMLPRLKPKEFYDLVVQVAIVRPGPIQGDMVHPYLKRRQGREKVEFPSPSPEHGKPDELKEVLSKTYGVPLFQEQAMKIAIVAAGFTPVEADHLRRSMASFRNHGTIHKFEEKFISGMTRRGYDEEYAIRCFKQIGGFADYGFPESHAAAFAMLAYASAWMKRHHPDVFACALLNAQPMGFYAPSQIVRDARDHGVEVRPVDINHSDWDCTLESISENNPTFALRLGMRHVKGLSKETVRILMESRLRPFTDVEDLHQRTRMPVAQIEKLSEADCFRSCGLDRRKALWQVRGLTDAPDLPLFQHAGTPNHSAEPEASLPRMPLSEHVVNDYQTLRLSLKAHPLSFLRPDLAGRGVIPNAELKRKHDGEKITVAGLALVRQRPGTSKGVVFMTLEDETGIANIVVWSKVFERQRAVIMKSRMMVVQGELQHQDGVIHVIAHHIEDTSASLLALSVDQQHDSDNSASNHQGAGQTDTALPSCRHADHLRNVKGLLPKSRDFH